MRTGQQHHNEKNDLSFESINAHIASFDLSELTAPTAVQATTGDRVQQLITSYAAVRPILAAVAMIPFILARRAERVRHHARPGHRQLQGGEGPGHQRRRRLGGDGTETPCRLRPQRSTKKGEDHVVHPESSASRRPRPIRKPDVRPPLPLADGSGDDADSSSAAQTPSEVIPKQ